MHHNSNKRVSLQELKLSEQNHIQNANQNVKALTCLNVEIQMAKIVYRNLIFCLLSYYELWLRKLCFCLFGWFNSTDFYSKPHWSCSSPNVSQAPGDTRLKLYTVFTGTEDI